MASPLRGQHFNHVFEPLSNRNRRFLAHIVGQFLKIRFIGSREHQSANAGPYSPTKIRLNQRTGQGASGDQAGEAPANSRSICSPFVVSTNEMSY